MAQGRTVSETLEIARDVARRLIEARAERAKEPQMGQSDQGQGVLAAIFEQLLSQLRPVKSTLIGPGERLQSG